MDNNNSTNTSTTPQDLRILFWNCRSINQRIPELQTIIKNLDILVCVETWLSTLDNRFDIKFPGFFNIREDRQHARGGGGIRIFVRKNIAYHQLNLSPLPKHEIEYLGIKITNTKPTFNLIAYYRPPGTNLSQDLWDEIFLVKNPNESTLFLEDFNSHHTAWNCNHDDTNGRRIFKCLDSHELMIHNSDSLSRLDLHSGNYSNLDLIISNAVLSDKIKTSVHDELWGSDHFPIIINIFVEKFIYHKPSFKISSIRTDWSKVFQAWETPYPEFFETEYCNLTPSEKYNAFIDKITLSVKENTPHKRHVHPSKHRNPTRWWDSDCDRAKRLRKAALKKWSFSQSPDDLISFKKVDAETKKLFKKKKKENFREFACSIDGRADLTFFWNNTKILKNSWVNNRNINVKENLQLENKIGTVLDKISPSFCLNDPNYLPTCQDNNTLSPPFNYTEFNIALDSKKNKSSPGLDGIDYNSLRNLPYKLKLILLDILNAIYLTGDFPNDWKEQFIHFIKKSNGSGVRPIALSSCVCKLLETMIKNRLQWWVETNNILPSSQSGLRKGRSCLDNLTAITLYIEDGFYRNQETVAAFLDVQGAFENVNTEILMNE